MVDGHALVTKMLPDKVCGCNTRLRRRSRRVPGLLTEVHRARFEPGLWPGYFAWLSPGIGLSGVWATVFTLQAGLLWAFPPGPKYLLLVPLA